MSATTKIEWCDMTFNPWIGCTKVSPGCANCYAEREDGRRKWTADGWGKGKPRRRTSVANWRQPLKWNRKAQQSASARLADYLRPDGGYRRPRVFCASLADWLDPEVPIEWLADLLKLIRETPNLSWLLLSKRPQNWWDRLYQAMRVIHDGTDDWISDWLYPYSDAPPPPNVWIGTSIEDQQHADERIPELIKIPARIRFLSCEPLLGSIDLSRWLRLTNAPVANNEQMEALIRDKYFATPEAWAIHHVIVGGESGPKARPMEVGWAQSVADQCAAAGVPFFMKQGSASNWPDHKNFESFPEALKRREFP